MFFAYLLFLEIRFYVAQPGLKLTIYITKNGLEFIIFLTLPPRCWDYRYVPLYHSI